MAFALAAETATQLTSWANSPGGMDEPSLNRTEIAMPNLAGLAAQWDAPLPPPARIDFRAIEAEARPDMNERFADLHELKSYWSQPAAAAAAEPKVAIPAFMQSPAAAEPSVYYGEPQPAPQVSMGALNRAERYAAAAVGTTFNNNAAKPLSHMSGFAAAAPASGNNTKKHTLS